MNRTELIKACAEFGAIRKRGPQGRAGIIEVPGHNGRRYQVTLTRNGCLSATCEKVGDGNVLPCPGNSNKSVCYHVLAACEAAAKDQGQTITWDSEQDALDKEAGTPFCVHSAQGTGEARGIVVAGKFSLAAWAKRLEKVSWFDAALAQSLAENGCDTPQQYNALEQLMAKYSQYEPDLTRLFADAILAHNNSILRGEDTEVGL